MSICNSQLFFLTSNSDSSHCNHLKVSLQVSNVAKSRASSLLTPVRFGIDLALFYERSSPDGAPRYPVRRNKSPKTPAAVTAAPAPGP